MVVFVGMGGVNHHSPRHPQMNNQRGVIIQIHQNVFRAAVNARDALTHQLLRQARRKRNAQVFPVLLHMGKALPRHHTVQPTAYGFNLRQFWHFNLIQFG